MSSAERIREHLNAAYQKADDGELPKHYPTEDDQAVMYFMTFAPDYVAYLLEIANAAGDVLADFDYVNEWGYEEGGKSLGDNLERLRNLLEQEPQDD